MNRLYIYMEDLKQETINFINDTSGTKPIFSEKRRIALIRYIETGKKPTLEVKKDSTSNILKKLDNSKKEEPTYRNFYEAYGYLRKVNTLIHLLRKLDLFIDPEYKELEIKSQKQISKLKQQIAKLKNAKL